MAIENFINFGVAISYFVGIFFAFLKFNYILDILLGAIIISGMFFLAISLCSTLVLKYLKLKEQEHIEKDVYETILEDYKIKINKKHFNFESLTQNIYDLGVREMMEKDRRNQKKALNNED